MALHKDKSSEVEVIFISLDDAGVANEELMAFNLKNGIDLASYRFNSQDSASSFITSVYPDWNNSVPLNLLYAGNSKAPVRFVSQTGLTDRNEVQMMISQDKLLVP